MPRILLLRRATTDLRAWEWLAIKRHFFPGETDDQLESGTYCSYTPRDQRDHQEQCELGRPLAILIGEADLAPGKEVTTCGLIDAAPQYLHIGFDRDHKLVRLSVQDGKIVREPLPPIQIRPCDLCEGRGYYSQRIPYGDGSGRATNTIETCHKCEKRKRSAP